MNEPPKKGPPTLLVRSTRIPYRPTLSEVRSATTLTVNPGAERKIYKVSGNQIIPVTASEAKNMTPVRVRLSGEIKKVKATSPPVRPSPPQLLNSKSNGEIPPKPTLKEVKEEPKEEGDAPGAVANITAAKPINLEEVYGKPKNFIEELESSQSILSSPEVAVKKFKRETMTPDLHLHLESGKCPEVKEEPEDDYFDEQEEMPSTSSAPSDQRKQPPKRNRKQLRHDDFVYEDSTKDPLEPVAALEDPGPSNKRVRMVGLPEGCRCEYVGRELMGKMDRIVGQMRSIEYLAKTLLGREANRDMEQRANVAAQQEIECLKRQLIVQRNHKSLNSNDNFS